MMPLFAVGVLALSSCATTSTAGSCGKKCASECGAKKCCSKDGKECCAKEAKKCCGKCGGHGHAH